MIGDRLMQCKYMNLCSFIVYGNHAAPFTSKMTRLKYCELVQDGCARYHAYQAMDADIVPDDLWPNLEIKTLGLIEKRLNGSKYIDRVSALGGD